MKKNRGERRSGYMEACVYLRAKENNLSIVRDGELLKNFFLCFQKNHGWRREMVNSLVATSLNPIAFFVVL